MSSPTTTMQANAAYVSDLLKGLANAERLSILCLLSETERTVTELQAATTLAQSALSQHLAKLRGKNMIDTRKQGRHAYYYIKDDRLLFLFQTLHNLYCAENQPQAAPIKSLI